MLQLFKIEWLKVKTYIAFWVLFLAFLVMFPLVFYFSASKFMERRPGAGMEEEGLKAFLGSPFVFPKIWLAGSWFGGLFFIMIGMLFILLVTNEVQYRTHRQNIIDGWSRLDFLKAKMSMVVFFVLVSTVLVFITSLVVGLIFSPAHTNIMAGARYIGYFALMATIYLMLAFLIAILIKRTGLAIIIYFAIVCILDNLLWMILTLKDSQIGYFLPLESADSLVPNPFKPAMLERRTVADSALIGAVVTYIVMFGYIIVSYFRKTDLKT
jgi:hypothetical protein